MRSKSKKFAMKYIWQTGRKLKCRIEETKSGLKIRFSEKVGQKEKYQSSGLLGHSMRKNID